MLGLNHIVVTHRLNIHSEAKLVNQQHRRFRPDIMAEVRKLVESRFIEEEQHLDWVANIVSVTKKNGMI